MSLAFDLRKSKGLREDRLFQSFKLVRLWDILKFCSPGFVRLCCQLTEISQAVNIEQQHGLMFARYSSASIIEDLRYFAETCEYLGLITSTAGARRLLDYLQGEQVEKNRVKQLADQLVQNILDEFQGELLLPLRLHEVSYFDGSKNDFPCDVRDAFSSAEYDMTEAGKCFALRRYTAAVFHLMRVMEAGLNVFGNPLGISVVKNWHSTLVDIEAEIKTRNVKPTPIWKTEEPFFAEGTAHFRMVKDAWRNHTAHIVEKYSEERACDIFNSVSAFMRHLATRLHE